MADLLIEDDDDLLLDPPPPQSGLSPADDAKVAEALRDINAVAPIQQLPLMQLLPADFPLPTLIRFVPDERVKLALDDAVAKALAIDVVGPEGIKAADLALGDVRDRVKVAFQHFDEPASQAHALHSSITSRRGEWVKPGENAVSVVGRRIAAERARLQAIADEERRKAQEEANRQERERRRKEAEEAEKAKAPAAVVETMRQEAERAQAAPVPVAAAAPPELSRNTVVTTWKARVKGTPADAEPNPEITNMTPAQVAEVKVLLQAIVDGKATLACIAIDWSYANKRAKAEQRAMEIPGLEAFDESGTRAKPTRRARI